MNTRRLILALVGALVISAVCTLLLGRRIASRTGKSEPKVQYVAASAAIGAGEIVKPEQVSFMDWPASQPVDGAFAKREDVVGRATLYPMDKGQMVLNNYLAPAGSSMGLVSKIPDGMRAIALKTDEVMGVAGFLYPGSRVDVLVTYRPPQGNDPITSTVMQNAQVLAVGHEIQPDPTGKPIPVNVMTLLANLQDAEKIVLASTQGTLHFVLRNGGDHAEAPNLPVQLTQLGAPVASKASGRKSAPQSPTNKSYVVETFMGDKQTTVSFN